MGPDPLVVALKHRSPNIYNFISDMQGLGQIVQELRHFVVDGWGIEAGRAGKLSHLFTPAIK
jgi:hypothetical protein